MQSERTAKMLMVVFFTVLLLVGLLTSADYGQPWDEPWEQDILRMNGNQYASALQIEGRFTLQSDMQAPPSGLIADSIEKDHGQSAYYPVLWLVGNHSLSDGLRMTLWHAYTWLWFVAAAIALCMICRRLNMSRFISCIASLLLVLSPRMFAEGHYNNKDMVLLALVLVVLWQTLRLMDKPSVSRALWFALAGAVAANTKIIGLPVWGLCALFVLVRLLSTHRMNKQAWIAALTALFGLVLFYVLLTPAMWHNPLAYLQYVLANATGFTRWENDILFRGTVFQLQFEALPRYYLPYMIAVTTPLWILALALLGQVSSALMLAGKRRKQAGSDTSAFLLLCTLLWSIPMAFVLIQNPTMYNGWRHFYFLYAPIVVLAAYGLHRLWQWALAKPRVLYRNAAAVLLAGCVGIGAVQTASNHPNQYVYYNALPRSRNVPQFLELDYWNVSVLPTLQTFAAKLKQEEAVTIAGAELWSQTGLEAAYPLLDKDTQAKLHILPQGSDADFILSNTTYAVLGGWQPTDRLTAFAQTNSFGWPLCTVYARESQ